MSDELQVSRDDEAIARVLLDDTVTVEVSIPDAIGNDVLDQWIKSATLQCGRHERAAVRYRPAIGRMLSLAADRGEEFLNAVQSRTYDEYIGTVEQWSGLKRPTLYQARRLYRKFPSLTPAQFEQIGPPKLSVLAKFTDETQPSHVKHLAAAREKTLPQVRSYAEAQKYIAKGEATPGLITIATTQDVVSHWEEFIRDGRVHQVVGTPDQGRILEAMLQECSSWVAEGES